MSTKIAVVVAALVVVTLHAWPVAAQNATPIDHWHGTVTGIVEQVRTDSLGRQVVTMNNGKTYRIRAADSPVLGSGDGAWINRDFVLLRAVPAAASGLAGLAAARAKCRADWPADFVLQRTCIEMQEEAYRDLVGR